MRPGKNIFHTVVLRPIVLLDHISQKGPIPEYVYVVYLRASEDVSSMRQLQMIITIVLVAAVICINTITALIKYA